MHFFIREKRKTDKGIVMTHIFKKSFPGHRSRSAEEELVLAINPTNGRILNYQQTTNLKKLSFPLVSFCFQCFETNDSY
jgi:hypothetical protein